MLHGAGPVPGCAAVADTAGQRVHNKAAAGVSRLVPASCQAYQAGQQDPLLAGEVVSDTSANKQVLFTVFCVRMFLCFHDFCTPTLRYKGGHCCLPETS